MTILPQYFDNPTTTSTMTRNSWSQELLLRAERRKYWDGSVFSETQESQPGEEDVELYPVGINLVKMLCLAQADSLFGEYDEDLVTFSPSRNININAADVAAADLLQAILRESQADTLLWEMALEREIYGGSPMKVTPQKKYPYVRFSRVALDSFFPVWDPTDLDVLLEVYIVTGMTPEQAKLKYGINSKNADLVDKIAHWTPTSYETLINDVKVLEYSGINPWGFVPFVYIPRLRSTHWWGDSLTEDVKRAQDELNLRVADIGDAINYSSHPIKWGYNLPRSFSPENYPVGPGVFWDMGRVIGQSPQPTIGILESKNPIPQASENYVNFLYDWSRTSVFAPPIAFGDDNGGGQRSGATLEIRMLPLIRATRRSRKYMSVGLMRAAKMAAMILAQRNYNDIGKRALESILDGRIVVSYSLIMPRDQASIVDQVVKQFSTPIPTISLETAVKNLGHGISEVSRIDKMLSAYKEYLTKNSPDPEEEPANSDSGTGAEPHKEETE